MPGLTFAILGASSFIGSNVASAATAAGHRIDTYDRETFDVTNPSASLASPVDVVVFLAQDRNYSSLAEPALGVFAVNTIGVLNAAIKARDSGARAFLFASTGNVYEPSLEPLAEDSPLQRSDIYSTSKIFGEQILDLAADDLTICRSRLFGAYGPNQEIGLLAGLTNRVRSGQAVTLQPRVEGTDDGGFRGSLTHVDDIATALVELGELACDGHLLPAALNLAAADAVSIKQVADLIGSSIGAQPEFGVADGTRSFDLIADTTLAQGLLNTTFRPAEVGIPEALQPAP